MMEHTHARSHVYMYTYMCMFYICAHMSYAAAVLENVHSTNELRAKDSTAIIISECLHACMCMWLCVCV